MTIPKEELWLHGSLITGHKFSMRLAITQKSRAWLQVLFATERVIGEAIATEIKWGVITEMHEFLRSKYD